MAARSTDSLCDMDATEHASDIVNPDEMAEDVIYSPDSILDVVGCTVPDIATCRALWQSREALQQYILGKVNEAHDVLMTRHIKTYHYYIHIATRETGVAPEVLSHALGTATFTRDLLLEGTMARRYFTHMLHDLKKSEDAADMYAMKVPFVTATLLDLDHQEGEARQRTYQSAFPALLRSMPDRAPVYQRDSPVDLSDDLSSMKLGPSMSSSRSAMVG